MIVDYCTRKVPDIHQTDRQLLYNAVPTGPTTTIGNASVVLVTIQKKGKVRSSIVQMVRAMEDHRVQTTGLEPSAVGMAPPEGKT